MPIVLIATDHYATGQELASRIAEETRYPVVDRDILPRVAREASVDVEQLSELLDGAGPRIPRRNKTLRLCMCLLQRATLERLLTDDVICHGLAAHRYLDQVSHAILLRLQAAQPDKGPRRRPWLDLCMPDHGEPRQVDLEVQAEGADLEEVAREVVRMAGDPRYRRVTYSQHALQDLELASRVRVLLLPEHPDALVRVTSGTVVVEIRPALRNTRRKVEEIKRLVGSERGVDYVEVHVARAPIRGR